MRLAIFHFHFPPFYVSNLDINSGLRSNSLVIQCVIYLIIWQFAYVYSPIDNLFICKNLPHITQRGMQEWLAIISANHTNVGDAIGNAISRVGVGVCYII